jgi:hypothetical protein
MTEKKKDFGYAGVIKGDESLHLFQRTLLEFDQKFCEAMLKNHDFNVRIEVRGNKGKLVHCRVMTDVTLAPS